MRTLPDDAGKSTISSIEPFTREEIKAINALQRLADKWPPNLVLLAGSQLVVVPFADYSEDTLSVERSIPIFGITADGGDPDWDRNV